MIMMVSILEAGCSSHVPELEQPLAEDDTSVDTGSGTAVESSIQLPGNSAVNNGPARNSTVKIDDRQFALDRAMGEIRGSTGGYYNITLTLTDGEFIYNSRHAEDQVSLMFEPADASAILTLDMYYPGESFQFTSFRYMSNSLATTDNAAFFTAQLAFDSNGSGALDGDDKFHVVGGQLIFSGLQPDRSLRFMLFLDNGQTASGHYSGLFDFVQHRTTH